VPVEGVDVDLGAVGDHLGLELTGRRSTTALPAPEDQRDVSRPNAQPVNPNFLIDKTP